MVECPHCGEDRPDGVTLCCCCDFVHEGDRVKRNVPATRWLCTQCPNIVPERGFVHHAILVKHRPYKYCDGVNGGACKMFKERHEATDVMAARETDDV